MIAFINQFKLLFLLSWVVLYLVYPAWALPVSSYTRAALFLGLIMYFSLSAAVMNRVLSGVHVNKPVIVRTMRLAAVLRNNFWLVVIASIAVLLHLYPLSLPILIIGDESVHLQNGLWLYEYIGSRWQPLFQVLFWLLAGLLIFFIRKNIICRSSLKEKLRPNARRMSAPIVIAAVLLAAYFFLMKDMPYFTGLVRYPPVSKMIYFMVYSAFSINHIFPRIIQLILYLLCTVYLYRTINLYSEKETAILGASIYLFLPVVFAYAHLGELASGTIFFIVAISFYFLRFIKDADSRDLLLAAFFIGTGFLYKKPVLIMAIVCFAFFISLKIKKRDSASLVNFKVLSLALVPVFPWMIISKLYSWRDYTFIPSNLIAFHDRIIPYFLLVHSNVSGIISVFFVLSVVYVLFFNRNELTFFFSLILVFYMFFIISDMAALSPRFAMTFYPTIIVFVSLFFSRIIKSLRWRHAFKIFTVVLTGYLILICMVSPLNKRFLSIMKMKMHYFPSEKAMKWVKENVKDDEKILNIRILTSPFYSMKYGIERQKIVDYFYSVEPFSTPEKLKDFYHEQGLSYIMFPYSPAYVKDNIRMGILTYLKNNPYEGFREIAEFNLDENFIYIYTLQDQ